MAKRTKQIRGSLEAWATLDYMSRKNQKPLIQVLDDLVLGIPFPKKK
jgi:hypothetical protein